MCFNWKFKIINTEINYKLNNILLVDKWKNNKFIHI